MIGDALTAVMGMKPLLSTNGSGTSLWRTFELTVNQRGLVSFAALFLLWVALDTICFMECAAKSSREQSLGSAFAGASQREDALNDEEELFDFLFDGVQGPDDPAFDARFLEAESPPRPARRTIPRIVTPDKVVGRKSYREMAVDDYL